MTTRGMIITNVRQARTGHVFLAPRDLVELRRYALYWDKIAWPSNNIAGSPAPPDAQELASAGVLVRPRFAMTGDAGDAAIRSQFHAFRIRNQMQPRGWAPAQDFLGLQLPEDQGEPTRGLEVELMNVLPVPTADVPISHVLEYRAKRASELEQLRNATDELYLDALQ